MALPSTIHKLELTLSDTGRHYYRTHELVIARHPSETEERMMLRVLAFAWHADPDLAFGKGLSTDDEPDLWQRDPTGAVARWIDVGWPDDKRLRRAAGRADAVSIFTYGGPKAGMWWKKTASVVARTPRVSVWSVDPAQSAALARLAARNMTLDATLADGTAWFGDGRQQIEVRPERLDERAGSDGRR